MKALYQKQYTQIAIAPIEQLQQKGITLINRPNGETSIVYS
ncbi:MAG: hypothetical protein AAF298_26290 [Cyanobacteria bacterium P01_A01_bin.40]